MIKRCVRACLFVCLCVLLLVRLKVQYLMLPEQLNLINLTSRRTHTGCRDHRTRNWRTAILQKSLFFEFFCDFFVIFFDFLSVRRTTVRYGDSARTYEPPAPLQSTDATFSCTVVVLESFFATWRTGHVYGGGYSGRGVRWGSRLDSGPGSDRTSQDLFYFYYEDDRIHQNSSTPHRILEGTEIRKSPLRFNF